MTTININVNGYDISSAISKSAGGIGDIKDLCRESKIAKMNKDSLLLKSSNMDVAQVAQVAACIFL